MKRTIIYLFSLSIVLLFSVTLAQAQNEVSLKEGDLSFFQEEESAAVEFDFSKAKVGEEPIESFLKKLGDDYVTDWPLVQEEARSRMISEFNRKSKGLKFRENETMVKARYKFNFKILYYKPGDQKMKNVPLVAKSGGDTISGTLEVIDRESGEKVCSVLIDEIRGKSYPADGVRLGYVFTEVMKRLMKLAEK